MMSAKDASPVTVSSPPPAGPALSLEDPRVLAAVEEYLHALQAGNPPQRQEFLARYPLIAGALAECLEGLEFVQAAGPHLQPPAPAEAGPWESSTAELATATPLGDFRLLRELGRGGMGVVYEAEQLSLGRRVALKVLPFAAALDARQLQRFKNEAQAAAHLHHHNIVPVYAVGSDRGVHYYAMQYIEGQSLAAMIHELRQLAGLEAAPASTQGPVLAADLVSGRWAPAGKSKRDPQPTGPYSPPPADLAGGRERSLGGSSALSPKGQGEGGYAGIESVHPEDTPKPAAAARSTEHSIQGPAFFRTVAHLGVQAAEALEHAHQLGVVHRDIKPANLLVDGGGQLWITDFGLAHIHSDTKLTLTGDLVGTLRYMSPEQALANRVVIDHRTDIYSLGATLYEMLTLEPAFTGSDRQEILRQIAFEEPRLPRRLRPTIPRELETIVLKALAKNPDERYATAQHLADDLGRFLKDEPIRAKRPSLVQRVRKWGRRHQTLVWSGVVVLLLAVMGLAISTLLIWQQMEQTHAALEDAKQRKQEADTQGALAAAKAAEAQAQYQRAEKHLTRAKELAERGGNLARALLNSGQPKEADKASQQVMTFWTELAKEAEQAKDPHAAEYWRQLGGFGWNLGVFLVDVGLFYEAAAALGQGVKGYAKVGELCPIQQRDNIGEWMCLGVVLWEHGDMLRATGQSQAAEGAFQQALQVFDQLFGVDRSGVWKYERAKVLTSMALLLADGKRPQEAEKAHREALGVLSAVLPSPKGQVGKSLLWHEQARAHSAFGRFLHDAGKAKEAAQEFRTAKTLWEEMLSGRGFLWIFNPGYTQTLPWFLVTCPDPQFHDATRAVEMMTKAFQGDKGHKVDNRNAVFWNTLGVAQYRAKEWQNAIQTLEKTCQLRSGGIAADHFFLAMAHWQLKDQKQARSAFDKGVAWMDKHNPRDEELRRFRREAAELLGIDRKK